MNVSVIGAGKMGLPLACQFATRGATVTACDKNNATIAAINAGQCPINEPGLSELLVAAVKKGALSATTDTPAAVAKADVIIVIVPVLLTHDTHADTSIIAAVTDQIAANIKPGTLVSYETTLPVGTTRSFAARIEAKSGLKAGTDFFVAFSPERVKSQHVVQQLTRNPKIVGGINAASAAKAEDFYGKYLGAPVINIGTLEAAELVKLAGMLYRDVNIALSNQLACYAETVGADIHQVIRAANTDGEANLLTPGIGVGGHCTPIYPYFLIHDSVEKNVPISLAAEARRVNDYQPLRAIARVARAAGSLQDVTVAILGLAFRPEVKEHICSPIFALATELERHGANVMVDDPCYSADEIRAFGFQPIDITTAAHCPRILILNTAHKKYAALDFAALCRRGLAIVYDGRAAWKNAVLPPGLVYLCV